jgi:hypothetical protein
MKTIINKNTGLLIYATAMDFELQENEIAIDELLSENFVLPYFNFETRTFYEGATQTEIDEIQTITEPTVEEIIQTVQSLESQLNEVKEQLNNL